jgi:uncharacterized protein (DUF305 family)
MPKSALLLALALGLLPAAALAQQQTQDMKMAAGAGDSSAAFKAADDKMMKNMAVPLTGNTDKDFVAGMIPHHEGAIDMARIELKDGKDPALKKLAGDIIAAQNKEIAFMKAWQAKHGG